jgi:hypothetical protein
VRDSAAEPGRIHIVGENPTRVDQPPVVSLGAYLVTDKFGEEATTVDYLISLTCSISKSIG